MPSINRFIMHYRRNKRLRVATLFLIPLLFLGVYFHHVFASIYGVPPAYTGAPYDGVTCATLGCHIGPVIHVTGLIQTDIPPTGYNPSDTYNITLSISRPNTDLFGFQITVGDQFFPRGHFLITDPVETQYSISNNYVTHREAGSYGANQKTWQMKWVAPDWPVETPLAVYASLVAGVFLVDDEVLVTTLPLTLNQHVGEGPGSSSVPEVYPNPFNEWVVIRWSFEQQHIRQVKMYSSDGAPVAVVSIPASARGEHAIYTGTLAPGTYFVEVESQSARYPFKLIKAGN